MWRRRLGRTVAASHSWLRWAGSTPALLSRPRPRGSSLYTKLSVSRRFAISASPASSKDCSKQEKVGATSGLTEDHLASLSKGPGQSLAASVGEAARGVSRELGAPRWPNAAEG